MGIKKKVLIGIMIILFLTSNTNNIFYGYESNSFIEKILNEVNVSVLEYQSTARFMTIQSEEEVYSAVIKELESVMGQVEINSKDKNQFKIHDEENQYSAKLTMLPYKENNSITLSISRYGEDLGLDEKSELATKIKRVLSIFDSNVEYSLCVKSEIINNTMDEVREIVNNNLSLFHAKNTDEVKLNNGYSIIGYTGLNNKRTILGKDIDFNCAIVKYSSGCYLIMGEPEITITY